MAAREKTNWRKVKLGDFADINPSVRLERGKSYPFVDMADVSPLTRIVGWEKAKQFNGSGAHFEAGDTLFARITPCLENGKITQILNVERPGFGSTEFIILRGKENISDTNFVYYLSRSYRVRKLAEQSMIGASGRQRVERTAFEKIEIHVPADISDQRRIASILSTFDDKIENNNRIIKTLEEMAQAVFKEWFVKFRFPGHEKAESVESELGKIPKWWEVKRLGDVIKLEYGKALKDENRKEGKVAVVGSSGIVGSHDVALVKGPGIVVGRKGTAGTVIWIDQDFYPIDTTFYVNSELPIRYSFLLLNRQKFIMGDSAVPGLNRDQAYFNQIIVPERKTIDEFESIVAPMFKQKWHLNQENQSLSFTRDFLLTKLMSGEVAV